MNRSPIKTYEELIKLDTFNERYEYLRLAGSVGRSTFGFDRYVNQGFYRSKEWRRIRSQVISRDNGYDLGHFDHVIVSNVIVHHMNPITVEEIQNGSDFVFNLSYLICVSEETHNAIHYGTRSMLKEDPIERSKNDTSPWLLAKPVRKEAHG